MAGGSRAGDHDAVPQSSADRAPAGPDHYLRTLLLLLISATFFEGYDSSILALVLPDIQQTFGVAESQLGVSRGIVELGLFFAFFLARLGDRIGRRTLLLWSVLGYTVTTTLTAVSWDLWSFTAFQSLSRVFLGAEYAVAVTIVIEEFPATRRASALGRLLMFSAAGAVAVALLLLGGLGSGPLQWRTLYLVGILPLLVLTYFRRRIRETRRFVEYREAVSRGDQPVHVSFWEPWKPAYRRSLVLVGTVHLLRSLPLFASTSWFFYYAEREQGVAQSFLYAIFIVAYGLGIAGYGVCGALMERIGRRRTAILYLVAAIVFAISLFQVREPLALGIFLVLAVFFGLGVAPVMGAMATELFPTRIRNQAAAWARNVFEIAGFILGPLLVGVLGDHYTGVIGSVGDTISFLFFLTLPCIWLVWRHLPETKGRELEQIEAEVAIATAAPSPTATRRRAFVAAAAAAVVVVGVWPAVATLGSIVTRPEGAAERFLHAASSGDVGRIREYGEPALARRLAGPTRPGTGEAFETIEVGRAVVGADTARVPYRVVRRDGKAPPEGTLVLSRARDGWTVRADASRRPDERVPSQGGGAPKAGGPLGWAAAALVGVVLVGVAEAVLRFLGPPPRAAPAAAVA